MRAFPNDDWFKGLGTTAEGVRFAEDNSAVVPGCFSKAVLLLHYFSFLKIFIIKIIILFHHYYRFNQILWFVFHQHQRRFNILKAFEFMSNQLTGIQSSRDQK